MKYLILLLLFGMTGACMLIELALLLLVPPNSLPYWITIPMLGVTILMMLITVVYTCVMDAIELPPSSR